jgi:hypothetical protein
MLKLIDTLISMALMFLILSVLASALTEAWSTALKKRSDQLKLGLIRLLGGQDDKTTPMDPVATAVLAHPWIANTANSTEKFPSYLTPQAFSGALVSALLNPQASNPAATTPVATTPWSAYASIDSLRTAVDGLNDPQLKTSMQTLLNEGAQSLDAFRLRAEALFNNQMDRVSGWYKRYTQVVTAIAGLVLVVTLNADAFRLFNDFWSNAHLRETATSVAAAMSDEPDMKLAVAKAQKSLSEANLQLGWHLGIGHYTSCVITLGDSSAACPSLMDVVKKMTGLLVSALAISLGADFWFKTMGTLLKLRSTGPIKKEPEATDKGKSNG